MFVDGCFWHGCPRHGTKPKTNAAFWRKKIQRNQARDKEVNRLLRKLGWKVLRIWEHELTRKNAPRLLHRLHAQPAAVLERCSSHVNPRLSSRLCVLACVDRYGLRPIVPGRSSDYLRAPSFLNRFNPFIK